MTHLEFVVLGPPISNQSPGPNLQAWKSKVQAEAAAKWGKPTKLTKKLKAIIINCYSTANPSVDLDNMSKPILDVLEEVTYEGDRQIIQAELSHVRLDAHFMIAGVSAVLAMAIVANQQFVYVRIEDPLDPLPLPK